MDRFLAYYIPEDEIPADIEVTLEKLCLSQYSEDDFKLEAIFQGNNGKQYWITLIPHIRKLDVQELLDKVRIEKCTKAKVVTALAFIFVQTFYEL